MSEHNAGDARPSSQSEVPTFHIETTSTTVATVTTTTINSGSTVSARGVPQKGKLHVNSVGEVIYKGHHSYSLMEDIQLSIRVLVGHITPKPARKIALDDFGVEVRTNFPSKGSELTPPHREKDFKCKDYCPMAFRHLRERFGIDPAHYMVSLCGDDALFMRGTPGKSDALFFFSSDFNYVLKTVSKKECKFLLSILPHYYNHVMKYPDTLIVRFFGMFLIQPKGGHNVRFIVMNNIFGNQTLAIHKRFDLKGSTEGRYATEEEKQKKNPILKDLDVVPGSIRVGADMRERIIQQLRFDTELLRKCDIMDYSLLLGIHTRQSDEQQQQQLLTATPSTSVAITTTTSSPSTTSAVLTSTSNSLESTSTLSLTSNHEVLSTTTGVATTTTVANNNHNRVSQNSNRPPLTTAGSSGTLGLDDSVTQSTYNDDTEMPGDSEAGIETYAGKDVIDPSLHNNAKFQICLPERGTKLSQFQKDDGGIASAAHDEIYFMGIIDILQRYNTRKKVERFFKSIRFDKNAISVASPADYAARFTKFMSNIFS